MRASYRRFLWHFTGIVIGLSIIVYSTNGLGILIAICVVGIFLWAGHNSFKQHSSKQERIDDLEARLHND